MPETYGVSHLCGFEIENTPDIKCVTLTEDLYVFIGENLSEERFFPEPLSKDF